MTYKPRPYQAECESSIFEYFANGRTGNPIACLPTGCHAKDARILMFDGSVKLVQDVQIGDLLMGPDSQPRRVLNLARGREQMVRIAPKKGEPFVVNQSHILSLYKTKEGSGYKCMDARIENIKVSEYIAGSNWLKHIRKIRRVGVNFSNNKWLPINARFFGMFLGDGSYTQASVNITSMDNEIIKYCEQYLTSIGDGVRIAPTGSKAFGVYATTFKRDRTRRTEIARRLDELGFRGIGSGEKFIPHAYKTASSAERLELLAGLIDTDGSLSCNGYDFISKSERLANDVVFVARSLGLAAYVKQCEKSCQTGATGIYYRVSISGECSKIPVLLERKKASKRRQVKNVLVTGFSCDKLQEDNFYGFELDGDHLYLTDDFTVHHNTGKSVIIASFIRKVFAFWPNQRVMMLTHVKELISQNAEKLVSIWPTAPIGVYSAGLGQRETIMPIVFGGVQSVAKEIQRSLKATDNRPAHLRHFGWRDLVLVDECHLISSNEDTTYQYVISELKKINPHLKVIGFTATPYRMKQGSITDDGLFTDVCFDITGLAPFNRLIEDGYLAPLIPKRTGTEIDVSNVGMSAGDFNGKQLQDAVDKDEITYAAVREMVEYGQDRQSWLVFASGVENAEHIASMLSSFGIPTSCAHSKLGQKENDSRIAAFKAGELRALVNNNKLTTGFDHPPIDLIGMLRPTMSPGLWVQMLGRGTRPSPGKRNCLVLDFAGNTKRLGPINDPVRPRRAGKGGGGEAPIRICDACGVYNHASARVCCACGTPFAMKQKLFETASNHELIKSDLPQIEWLSVTNVLYNLHEKTGSPPSIKVSYVCGLQMFSEWVCLEHPGFAGKKARDWWRQRHNEEPPTFTHEALRKVSTLRVPAKIEVWLNKKHPEVKRYEF